MMARGPSRRASAIVAALAVLVTGTARADDAKGDCFAHHENAQVRQKQNDYLGARESAKACAIPKCPDFVRADCMDWFGDLEKRVPSVVFEIRTPDGETAEATIRVDGRVVTRQFDGAPVEVNPGRHTFTVEVEGYPAQEHSVILSAGEKLRPIVARFAKPKPLVAAPAAPVPTTRPIPRVVYVLGGLAAASAISFVALAWSGSAEEKRLSAACAPFCPKHDVDGVTTRYALADVALGAGIVSLGAAAYFYLTRVSVPADVRPPSGARSVVDGFGIGGAGQGASVLYRGTF